MSKKLSFNVDKLVNIIKSTITDEAISKELQVIVSEEKLSFFIIEMCKDLENGNLDGEEVVNRLMAIRTNYSLIWKPVIENKFRLDMYLKYLYEDLYYMDGFEGKRLATQKEVDLGAEGLLAKRKWLFEGAEEFIKLLCLAKWLCWGKLTYYVEAGYKYNWDKENNRVKESVYELVIRARESLVDLYEILRNEEKIEEYKKKLNKAIRAGKHKYGEYAVDEVVENMSVKQLIYNSQFLWDFKEECMDSVRILAKIKYQEYKPSPVEISKLRSDYNKYIKEYKGKVKNKENNELKILCNKIELAVSRGILGEDSWGRKIQRTLKEKGYKSVSEKQWKVLVDVVSKLEKESNKVEETKVDDKVDSWDDELNNISDMLGSGML